VQCLKSEAAQRWLSDKKYREELRETKAVMEVGEAPVTREIKPLKEGEPIISELDMVLIEGCDFKMGDGQDDDNPVHTVKLDSFKISAKLITQAQYEAVMNTNPSKFKGPNKPVENVSWRDAMMFCERLTKETGNEYTLPTEAQWECACRAGSMTKYCFGDSDDELGEYAWYNKNSEGTTHPVGEKKQNDWGLYDMHGNVWEWCRDRYEKKYYNDPKAGDNPEGPVNGSLRVLRGGGWRFSAEFCRSAIRDRGDPAFAFDSLGFRVVRRP
jgi:eukaryotic-like serine/threonine-protein kinase